MNAATHIQAPTVKRTLVELTNLIAMGAFTDEDFKEFQELAQANKKAKESRNTDLGNIRSLIAALGEHGDPIQPNEVATLFSKEVISEVANFLGLVKEAPKSGKPAGESGIKRPPITRSTDSNIELFFFPKKGERGSRDASIHKGRIYEPYNNVVKTAFNKASPQALFDNAKSKESLMEFISPTNKQEALDYLATPEGVQELNDILAYVKIANNGDTPPNAAPPVAPVQAPAPEVKEEPKAEAEPKKDGKNKK